MLNLYYSCLWKLFFNQHFADIRLHGYWHNKKGMVNVFLRDGRELIFCGVVRLYYVDVQPWYSIPNSLVRQNFGFNKPDLYAVYREWFHNRSKWKGTKTMMDVLFCEWDAKCWSLLCEKSK